MNFKALVLCLLLLLPGPALAGQITLAWDYDVAREAGISGFKLYWKDSPGGTYTNYVTVGKTFRQTVITGLTDGQTYYFVATAYSATVESGYSNEVNSLIDNLPPVVAIAVPTSGPTYSTGSDTVTVEGTASDAFTGIGSVAWSSSMGGSGSCTGTTAWSCVNLILLPGLNTLTITARDGNLNAATDTLAVTYTPPDTTPPAVTITGPTSGPTYETGTTPISLSGTASDNNSLATIAWANSRGGSGACTGTTTWTCSGIVLLYGANVLTVTATDASANTATDTLTVTYTVPDTTPPSVAILLPTPDPSMPTAVPLASLSGSASDAIGVTSVTWSSDRGGSGTATGTTAWSVTDIPLLAGANVITITARDAANNAGTDTLTITYTPPSAGLQPPTSLTVSSRAPVIRASWAASPSSVSGYVVTVKCASGFKGMFWTRGSLRLYRDIQIPAGSTSCRLWTKAWKQSLGTVAYSALSNMCVLATAGSGSFTPAAADACAYEAPF